MKTTFRPLLTLLGVFFIVTPLFSQNSSPGLDEQINAWLQPIAQGIYDYVMTPVSLTAEISVPIVLVLLISAATFFTFYFRFPNIRYFRLAIRVVRGQYASVRSDSKAANIHDGDDPVTIRKEGHHGEVSPFQALTAALSATVGLGNVGMVAIAIAAGGPGATFWMIIAGLLGMSSKFTECTLGVKFREIDRDGTVYGGPMYYLSKGLKARGWTKLGKVLGVFYAIMLIGGSFGGGNMFQSNQAAAQFMALIGVESGYAGFLFGLFLAALVAVVIIGGIKRIGSVTEKVVPIMVGIYLIGALIILASNASYLPYAFRLIIEGAFQPGAAVGGFVAVLVQGFQRAAFSNEAGMGSASVAHSAVRTQYAASEGVVALLEPFIDTVLVCTMTALVIITTNINADFVVYGDDTGLNGVNLTSAAFDTVLPGFSYVLTIAIFLFAFSSMLAWSYYGLQAWKFLFGRQPIMDTIYKILFCFFIVVGSASSLGAVILFSDAMIFAMIFPNMIGLLLLSPFVKEEFGKYLAYIRQMDKR